MNNNDIGVLKKLGEEYFKLASLPVHKEKLALWKALNRCEMQRPMVCIDQLPLNELNGDGELTCYVEDPYWRGIEARLRKLIYMWRHFPTDMVLEPYITIPKAVSMSDYGLHENSHILKLSEGTTAPSRKYISVLKEYEDILKIKDMDISEDTAQSGARMSEAEEIFKDISPVIHEHGVQFHLGVWDYLSMLFGVEDAYFDIMDRPEFIHACMKRITDATVAGIEKANTLGLHNDISNTCHCSYVYTDELLPDFGAGKGPYSKHSWAFGMAQLFTSVSPDVTREFELPYISRMAEYFGMIYYGCCDRLDDRLDLVMQIPNVKKISCSPWSDMDAFADKIGKKHIMSVKPSPALLAGSSFDREVVKRDIGYACGLAKKHGINVEFILKDISTVHLEPKRLTDWADAAMEAVCSY